MAFSWVGGVLRRDESWMTAHSRDQSAVSLNWGSSTWKQMIHTVIYFMQYITQLLITDTSYTFAVMFYKRISPSPQLESILLWFWPLFLLVTAVITLTKLTAEIREHGIIATAKSNGKTRNTSRHLGCHKSGKTKSECILNIDNIAHTSTVRQSRTRKSVCKLWWMFITHSLGNFTTCLCFLLQTSLFKTCLIVCSCLWCCCVWESQY